MKKSKIVLALMSVLIVLSLAIVQPFAESAVPSPTYTVQADFENIEFVSGDPYMLDGAIAVRNYGTVLGLGYMNVSYYSKIEIQYCTDASAMSGDSGSAFCLTNSTVPVWNVNDPQILSYGNMTNAEGSWREDVRTVTIDLHGVQYQGDTYLAIFIPDGNGVDIISMTFTVQKLYTESEVDAMLKLGILNNAQYSFTVNAFYNQESTLSDFTETYPNNGQFSLNYSNEGVYFQEWYNYIKDSLLSNSYNAFEVSINVLLDNPVYPLYFHLLYNNPGYIQSSASNDTYIGIYQIELILDNEQTVICGASYSTFYNAYLLSVPDPDTVNEITNAEEYSYNIKGFRFKFRYQNIPITDRNSLNTEFEKFFSSDPWALSVPQEDVSYNVGYNKGYTNGYIDGEKFQQGRIEGLLQQNNDNWQAELKKVQSAYNIQINQMSDDYYKLQKAYNNDMQVNYDAGYDQGYIDGEEYGVKEGFNKGISTQKDESLRLLIFSVFDAIGSFMFHFIGFDFLGINLLSLLTAIFTLVIFFFLLGWLTKILGKL